MKFSSAIVAVAVLLAGRPMGFPQGFLNLNFESANLTGYPPEGLVPATNAFPGWVVSAVYIPYDDFSLSGESISIMDTNSPYFTTSIQGKYYVLFEAGNDSRSSQTISLGQTGTIPSGTESVTFWGNDEGMQITFNGQPLNFFVTGSTANYNIYAADISEFAGHTGQLLFTVPPYTGSDELDYIQFSSVPVPEPSEFGLAALGALLLGLRRWRK